MSDNSKYPLLNTIDTPSDLRQLPIDRLPQLCDELRAFLIDILSENPGHFASSLGTVELTVALHYVYDTPHDRLVWDVGHQAYGHKVLTGRRDRFHTNRKLGGIRPFPTPAESEYDTFACGHASNSISAALGMAVAACNKGESRNVVAIIGDGSMSGGLAFEGLNNAGAVKNNMLIVLNDNNMSIDSSVGGLHTYLHRLHTSAGYNRLRYGVSRRLLSWGWLNDKRQRAILRFNNAVKALLVRRQNVFEGMDLRYFGPVDGHDVIGLVRTLRSIRNMRGPKLLHINTVKGHGYEPAEKNPTVWHAPGRFDLDTGERMAVHDDNMPPLFQEVFGHTLLELAGQNPRIVGVTPAMPSGCSMNIMMERMPGRTFDVGIAEGHAVTFSAGMAKDGLMPFCNIYSSFAQRSIDNIVHDVALLHLDMVLCLDRAGIVGEDGPTHHGAFDIAMLRSVPGITIASPMCESELRNLMFTAQEPGHGLFVIRYPRGRGVQPQWRCPMEHVEPGTARILRRGTARVAVLSLGPVGNAAARAIAKSGIDAWHVDMRFAKPLDTGVLDEVSAACDRIVTIEDGVRMGGMGSAVLEYLSDHGYKGDVVRLGLPDEFVPHGSQAELYRMVGLDEDSIAKVLS